MPPTLQTTRTSPPHALALLAAGVAVGILTGLSVSPVVKTVLSSVLGVTAALVAALAGLPAKPPEAPREDEAEAPAEAEPRKKTKKPDPPRAAPVLDRVRELSPVPMGLYAAGIILGVVVGVLAREYDVLSPTPAARAQRWAAAMHVDASVVAREMFYGRGGERAAAPRSEPARDASRGDERSPAAEERVSGGSAARGTVLFGAPDVAFCAALTSARDVDRGDVVLRSADPQASALLRAGASAAHVALVMEDLCNRRDR